MDDEAIIGYEALWESMAKCKRGVLWKDSVANFVLNAPRELVRLARLVREGKIAREKVDQCYQSWRNHAAKGNSYRLLQRMDKFYTDLWRDNDDQH